MTIVCKTQAIASDFCFGLAEAFGCCVQALCLITDWEPVDDTAEWTRDNLIVSPCHSFSTVPSVPCPALSASLTCSVPTYHALCSTPGPPFHSPFLSLPHVFSLVCLLTPCLWLSIISPWLVLHEARWVPEVLELHGALRWPLFCSMFCRYRFQDQNRWITRKEDQTTDMVSLSFGGVACFADWAIVCCWV